MAMMDSDEAFMSEEDEEDSGPESGEDETDVGISMVTEERKKDLDDFHYCCLEPGQIVEHMCEIIREVTNIVQIPPTTCRILLHHFKWNKEKLVETYYDSDQEELFRNARVISPFSRMTPSTSAGVGRMITRSGHNTPTITRLPTEECCTICYQTHPASKMTGLECGHRFCSDCWGSYLTTKIMDEGKGQTIACAAHGCDILLDDANAMRLIPDSQVKRRYQHLITNSFVECNRLLSWCPKADCGCAIKVNHFDVKPVTCRCSTTFCFGCGSEWHDPVNCRLLKLWIKKCNDDSETSNWIAANTKECPKCNVTIEKDGGCNHMTCKNQSCKSEFCWVCLGPWEPHGSQWYACNRYDDQSAKFARDAQERSRAALQRYLHYCNRYMNHMQSMKFENKLYATVKTKMEQMQQHSMSWIEVQFLKKAVDVLCSCRRTLMFTYVFAYYLVKNNQSIMFEDNQKDLELATEQLSEFLERDLEKENLTSLKQKVQDKYRYCENRRKVLLDHCHEGDEKDWWEYNS